jgi:uncharacterized protein YhaN
MIQLITTTLKTARVVKATSTVLPIGTVILAGVKRMEGTVADRAIRTAMLEGVLDSAVGSLSRLKKGDSARIPGKEAVRIARENLKKHEAGIQYKSIELLAILTGVHPTVTLDRSEKGFLIQSLKGLTIEADLA